MTAVWLIAGTKVGETYPCRCAERKYSRCSPKYCPCSGRLDADQMPAGCCSRTAAKPATANSTEGLPVYPTPPTPHAGPEKGFRQTGDQDRYPRDPALSLSGPPDPPSDGGRDRGCSCPTPWEKKKASPGGVHCVECHTNWQSLAVYGSHRPSIWGPCRDPRQFRDVDTGRPLMTAYRVGSLLVWGWAPNNSNGQYSSTTRGG